MGDREMAALFGDAKIDEEQGTASLAARPILASFAVRPAVLGDARLLFESLAGGLTVGT